MSIDLSHFIQAQNPVYADVLDELAKGKKTSHWMWFIFPQLKGLGHSSMAEHYALENIEQAKSYLTHPILGKRIIECAQLLVQHPNKTALEIFGSPDHLKLHSSLTLFAVAAVGNSIFEVLLQQFFNSSFDHKTMQILTRT